MNIRRVILLGLFLPTAALLVSCAAPKTESAEAGLPGDLALSVTVYSEYQDPELIARLERWRRPGRYVIEPDWLLRSAIGAGARESEFPPGTRQLDREQVESLWRAISQSGLLREQHPDAIPSEQTASPPAIGTTAIIAISHNGSTDARRIVFDSGGADAQAVAGLVDQLAALSWIRE